MDDYISKTEAFDIVRFECGEWSGLAMTIGKRFDNLPYADVQQVVRCKDCKSFSHGYCKFHDAKFVRKDGYCYWGERKDGEH